MPINKNDLKKKLKDLRLGVSFAERKNWSQQICSKLESMDWDKVDLLHCFEPIERQNEVDVEPFIAKLQVDYPEIKIYTSKQINGAWEIVSWKDHEVVKTPQFDAVIVPMLGFDKRLHRVGYGGGYYDKMLKTQLTSKKI